VSPLLGRFPHKQPNGEGEMLTVWSSHVYKALVDSSHQKPT